MPETTETKGGLMNYAWINEHFQRIWTVFRFELSINYVFWCAEMYGAFMSVYLYEWSFCTSESKRKQNYSQFFVASAMCVDELCKRTM